MHEFKYKRSELYCESLKISDIVKGIETPFYLYSYKTLLDHYRKLKKAFHSINPLICFSMKANSNLAICQALIREGAGLDIVSGGELFKARKLKAQPKKIVYASVGKTEEEIRDAVNIGILFFNVESLSELKLINRIAASLHKKVQVAIRINPDVEPKTHTFITTGKLTNKFGIDFKTAHGIFSSRSKFPFLKINGLHIHIGSQIMESSPFVSAIKKVVDFAVVLKNERIDLEWLNIGGGLGIIYKNEKPQTASEFAASVLPLLKEAKLKVILEPGRFIVGNAGVLVTKVLFIKVTRDKKFVIVDCGMNDLIRPALYSAYHEILPIRRKKNILTEKVDVVGPICESGDFLAKSRILPAVKEGEFLAVMGAGAYGYSMSSNYNCRPRAAEVMVIDDKIRLIRRKESYQDLIRGDIIPGYVK